MESKTTEMTKDFLISFFLPDGMTDRFDVVRVSEDANAGTAHADILYTSVLNLYLDERDNRLFFKTAMDIHPLTAATIVIDSFHIVRHLCESLEEMRLRFKRLAVTESKKAAAAFARNEDRKAKIRAYYRRTHPKSPVEKRGRKRIRKQEYNKIEKSNWEFNTLR